jgi:endoglucanase
MLPRKIITFLCILLISLPSFALSPVGTHGTLKVAEGKIIGSKDNQPVQLAGMSLFWSLWEGEKYYNRKAVNWLVQNWNITVIRACLGIGQTGSYDTDPTSADAQYGRIKTVVDAAIANGIYVIVDYHAYDANLSVDKAKKFFSDISKEYSGIPNIIWEIWNEPDNKNGSGIVFPNSTVPNQFDNWGDVKKYASQVIPVIRANSDNLIVVGTPSWSQHVDTAAGDPLSYPDIAYTLHFYAAQKSHQDSLRERAQAALNLGAALFITEFGTTIADGGSDGVVDSVQTKIWLDWADSNSVSWVNWSIGDKGEASSALKTGAADTGGWTIDKLTTSGTWVRKRLKSRPAYDFSDIIPDDGKSLPGLIEAESFVAKSAGLKSDATDDVGGGQALGYTSNGAWAEYQVIVRKAGEYKARLRVSSAESGTITLKAGAAKLASWTIGNTGGWSTWKTTDNSSSFTLAAGDLKLRAEWSGTASSLVNLNWVGFTLVSEADSSDTATPPDTGSTVIVPDDGKTLPGRIEAESLKSKSDALTIEATSDTGGGKSLGYTTNGAWAEYTVTVAKSGKYTVRYRVAADQGFGGTIAMKFDDKKVGSMTSGATGGWASWKTIDATDTFELTKGETVLRIEWSGTASSLVNLNWMDFTFQQGQESVRYEKAAPRSPFRSISIANGTLSLGCPDEVVKIALHSIDGRVIKSITPASRRISMPIGKGVFVLAIQDKDGSVRSMRIANVKE